LKFFENFEKFLFLGFGAIPGILSIFIVLPLRESPKFLLLNRNDRKAAIKSSEFYQGWIVYFLS